MTPLCFTWFPVRAVRPEVTIEGWMKPDVLLPEIRGLIPSLERFAACTRGILDVFAEGPPPLSSVPIKLGVIPQ